MLCVINETLQDNHQHELAIKMESGNFILSSTLKSLNDFKIFDDFAKFQPVLRKGGKPEKLWTFLNDEFGLGLQLK